MNTRAPTAHTPTPPHPEDCALLFGCSREEAEALVAFLSLDLLRDAFRRQAAPLHPDRPRAPGELVDERTRAFRRVAGAYERLCLAVRRREPAPNTPRLPAEPLMLGQYLHYSGRLAREDVDRAVAWQRTLRPRFGTLAMEWRFLTEEQLSTTRRARRAGERIGDAARRLGYLRADQCETLMWAQRQAHRRLGQFFVEEGLLSAAELCVLVEEVRQHNRALDAHRRAA